MISILCNFKTLRGIVAGILLAASSQTAPAQVNLTWKIGEPTESKRAVDEPPKFDPKVMAASLEDPIAAKSQPSNTDPNVLPPPTRTRIGPPSQNTAANNPRQPTFKLPKIESFTTAGAGLAIVVGLFLACMWLLRRSGPQPTAALPKEAIAVLGRVPLAARNFAHLLQVGNKLVLVAITPEGVSPITEITDPNEVQRLLGLCLRNQKQSTTAEFQNVLQQLAAEPASGFLGNEAATAYANQSR